MVIEAASRQSWFEAILSKVDDLKRLLNELGLLRCSRMLVLWAYCKLVLHCMLPYI